MQCQNPTLRHRQGNDHDLFLQTLERSARNDGKEVALLKEVKFSDNLFSTI